MGSCVYVSSSTVRLIGLRQSPDQQPCIPIAALASLCLLVLEWLPHRIDSVKSPSSATSTGPPQRTLHQSTHVTYTFRREIPFNQILIAMLCHEFLPNKSRTPPTCPSQCKVKSVATRAMHSAMAVAPAVLRPPSKQRKVELLSILVPHTLFGLSHAWRPSVWNPIGQEVVTNSTNRAGEILFVLNYTIGEHLRLGELTVNMATAILVACLFRVI